MAKPDTTHRTPKIQTDADNQPLLKPFTSPQNVALQSLFSDDLIRLLANSYENKRARQVGEWERAQAVAKKPFK